MSSWPRRRFRVTPLRAVGAFFIVGILFWYSLGRQEEPPQPCSVPEEFTEKLHDLAYRAHLVLTKLGVVHCLCFGSLWGQVRIGRALPWARKVDLCLVDTLRDDVVITKAFRDVGLSASYSHAAGIYHVQENDVGEDSPKIEIVVFEEDSVGAGAFWVKVKRMPLHLSTTQCGILFSFAQKSPEPLKKYQNSILYRRTQMMRRVGWTRRVLPPDCELSPSLQCFPPQLVIPPLPAKQFGSFVVPVPREGIELQKYHYPNDWWLEIKPNDCVESRDTNS